MKQKILVTSLIYLVVLLLVLQSAIPAAAYWLPRDTPRPQPYCYNDGGVLTKECCQNDGGAWVYCPRTPPPDVEH